MNKSLSVILTILAALCLSCSDEEPRHVIGVSQCSQDIWREKQNAELRIGSYFQEGVELRFASAYDSDDRQVEQIDSLVASGIDLLIVAPNQVSTISAAIDRAYDKGIPVIVFERKTNSNKYTAFMGADNYEMGHLMGEYIATQLNGRGKVLEIKGLKGSSPAIDRDKGFRDAIAGCPQIELVATLQGDWTEESAHKALMDYRGSLSDIDFVFGQNDRMALGARRAFLSKGLSSASLPRFCGIDGLPGEGGGIACVRDSILEASYIYPTHGDKLLQLAVDILEGKPYEKEIQLMSALVTRDNANVLLMEGEEVARQLNYLERLHSQADKYLQQLSAQRMVSVLAAILILLLIAVIISVYLYFLQKARLAEERNRMEREQLDFYTQVSHELRTPLTLIEGPLEQLAGTDDLRCASASAQGLFAIVRRNTHQLTELINKMLDMQARTDLSTKANGAAATANGPAAAEAALATSYGKDTVEGANPPEPSGAAENKGESPSADTVLIVDDNADIRAYLRSILQGRYQVSEAADGQQGLAVANEIVPDLIVSDVMMPVMNGLEFCQRIKASTATSHIPVILLTARALSQHQIEGYESGTDAYITKPFAADVLLARISNLLKSRTLLRDLFSLSEGAAANEATAPKDEAPAATETGGTASTARPESAAATVERAGAPMEGEVSPAIQQAAIVKENSFLRKFRDYIEANLTDSDLSVETIGAELGLSRVQLYRKVKALTGQSPVELLRTARLLRGRQLLETTDKTVSEVAYEVGFSAPSYFTKCFKSEFGISPSDV